jgi:phospholipase D1/2
MIVDDEYAIIGSANINDRSMLGDRDSEIAIYVEDPRAVAGLRKQLWKEHFGIIEDGSETHAIKTLMDVNEIRSEVLRTLNDPCSDACFDLWVESSRSNADIFRDVFGVVPCNELRTRKDFDARMELNQTRVVNIQTPEVVEQLGKLKGRLVAFQFTFLDQEENLSDPMPASASLCPREVFT